MFQTFSERKGFVQGKLCKYNLSITFIGWIFAMLEILISMRYNL